MVDYLKIIDFTKELKEEPRLQDHLVRAAEQISNEYKNDESYRRPVKNDDTNNIVIIAGLPQIPQEKVEKLQGFLKAKILPSLDLPEPQIEFELQNGEMIGNALFIFSDPETAKTAASKINGFQFDKTHTLSACTKSDFDEMLTIEDTYSPPKIDTREELQEWLLDHRNREQLLVKAQNRHYLQWFDHVSKAEPIFSGNTFKKEHGEVLKFEWSKSGSYLVTFHEHGFCLWGGSTFEKLNFYPHHEVLQVSFSPDETYALSFNGIAGEAPNSENYIVWRVGATIKLRSFKATQSEVWGSYKWNYDGKYLASFGNDLLNIYELPSMSRITDPQTQKKSPLKVPNIQNVEWAPNKDLLCISAYKTSTGKGETSGKIYVIEVPSRQNLKWKTITWEFTSCDIYWENTGSKIILALKKLIKNKKTSMILQIGDIKHNNIIVEEHEFLNAKVVNVDEQGKKIAVLSLEASQKDAQGSTVGYTVDLYRSDEEVRGKYLQKLGTFVDKPISQVMWSPAGTFFALVNIDRLSAKIGVLEFGFIKANTVEVIKSTKFSYMINAAWDPSGRFLFTSSSKGQYTIWTAFGDAIIKDNFAEITQIQWRPKPKIILPSNIEEQFSSNLKKYIKKFEDEDDRILNEDKYKKEKLRKEQREEFETLLAKKKKTWEETKPERITLLGFDEDNLPDVVYDEIIEGEEQVDTKK